MKAWEMMKEKRELISKSFQVSGITWVDPPVVWNDAVLKRALETVQQQLNCQEQEGEDDSKLDDDPFADIELED